MTTVLSQSTSSIERCSSDSVESNKQKNATIEFADEIDKTTTWDSINNNRSMDYFDNSFNILWTLSLIFVYLFTALYSMTQIFPNIIMKSPRYSLHNLPDLDKTTAHLVFMRTHIVLGLLTMSVGVLQIHSKIRRTFDHKLHRILGRIDVFATFCTAICGCTFITINGFKTVGGINMSIAFFVGGIWFFVTAFKTIWHIRWRRDENRHKRWALRCFFMSMASMLYRMHFVLFAVFGHSMPIPVKCDANGTCPDYLRPLDSFNAWFFLIGGELVLEFAIFSKRICYGDARKSKIRNQAMNVLSVVVSVWMATPMMVAVQQLLSPSR